MRHWIQTEQLDFAALLGPDSLHLSDLGYRCVGRLLADSIVDTVTPSFLTSRR